VEAVDQLYITGWAGNTFTSGQAAQNLLRLASGATLGELDALEEVIQQLVGRSFLTPVMLHEVWAIAERGAAGAGRRELEALRAACVVLSMAVRARPEAVSPRQVSFLLRAVLGRDRVDAVVAKYGCSLIQGMAANFADG
jgi:hypothetical protein